jgi:hypothetical protein
MLTGVDADRAALIFGIGPHSSRSVSGPGCVGPGVTRWPAGSAIYVVISERQFEARVRIALREALPSIAIATDGQVHAELLETAEPNHVAADNEISVWLVANPLENGCATWQGCAIAKFKKSYLSSGTFIAVTPLAPQAIIHDVVGHLALGLCHIDAVRTASNPSLMAFGAAYYDSDLPMGLTRRDLLAVRDAYQYFLPPRSSASDAVGRGLLPAHVASNLTGKFVECSTALSSEIWDNLLDESSSSLYSEPGRLAP